MVEALVWITGASSGIGRALVESVPWPDARVIGVSRRPPPAGVHLQADLADPAGWETVAGSFRSELAGFAGGRVVLVQAAGTLEPIGFAGEVDGAAYTRNVLVNSAAPQIVGNAFLNATRSTPARRQLVVIGSGAASTVYPGWSSYGAAKAAVDQWVRVVGEEQRERGGAEVLAVAPGVVATAMQDLIRATPEEAFPRRARFRELHVSGALADPAAVAGRIWSLLEAGAPTGSVLDLRSSA